MTTQAHHTAASPALANLELPTTANQEATSEPLSHPPGTQLGLWSGSEAGGSRFDALIAMRPVEEQFGSTDNDARALASAAFNSLLATGVDPMQQILPKYILSPEPLGGALHAIIGCQPANTLDSVSSSTINASTNGTRPSYNNDASRTPLALLAGNWIYNRPFAVADQTFNIRPDFPQIADGTRQINATLASGKIKVVLPFAFEEWTGRLDTAYAIDCVGAANVVACSADLCQRSAQEVRQLTEHAGATLVSQKEILSCINWAMVCQQCGIPYHNDDVNTPIKGSKGLTMLAGLITLLARRELDQGYVAFHDTDISNPHRYDCLRYLAMPLALAPEGAPIPRTVMLGKTGAGRNNEGWTTSANKIASNSELPAFVRKTAAMASTLIWPLTDARMIAAQDLMNIPWTTGMSIETQINVFFAGLQVERCESMIAQVCNGAPKIERQNPDPVREWALMERCQRWLEGVLHHTADTEQYLHHWSIDEVRSFNNVIGGQKIIGNFQSGSNTSNSTTALANDYMLPSLAQLIDMGAIDFGKLGRLVR